MAETLQPDGPADPLCSACERQRQRQRKDQPITGMTIVWGLKPDGKRVWGGGNVLDQPRARPTAPR